ncbi:MAG: iron-containing redox enzyme family protein [Xylophilus ampelinus]
MSSLLALDIDRFSPPPPARAQRTTPVRLRPADRPARDAAPTDRARYEALWDRPQDPAVRAEARAWLDRQLDAAAALPCDLPEQPSGLAGWMHAGVEKVGAQYREYLDSRKAGAPRRFFSNRAHALYFLRGVAPTKLVDGSWLYGVLRHWQNPRHADLVRTYVEELGDGQPGKNHVLLYRRLLAAHGLEHWRDLPDGHYTQGALQLALAAHGEDLLPEVIGFNLGYEQLPLHLLVTAYELNELGIDPYYFTLHVTVDNADSGHAQRAVDAVLDAMPRLGDGANFWRRVRNGYRLNELGAGTNSVIAGFDIQAEVERIFARKSGAGRMAHSDYCRVAGRAVNDWLSRPEQVGDFLAALEDMGWIVRDAPVAGSRFWKLLQGERAEMFGVFSRYELQVIHDWIRGPQASADGAPAPGDGEPAVSRRPASFRAQTRLAAARGLRQPALDTGLDLDDPDVQELRRRLDAAGDAAQQGALLVEAMAPAHHWTPMGLYATQRFVALAG